MKLEILHTPIFMLIGIAVSTLLRYRMVQLVDISFGPGQA